MIAARFDGNLLLTVESAINLCGTSIPDQIIRALPVTIAIPQVLFRDVTKAYSFSFGINGLQTTLRDQLEMLVHENILALEKPSSDEEWALNAKFSADPTQEKSEAAIRAIALHRQWGIICEHAYTKRFCDTCVPRIKTHSSLELIRYWGEMTDASAQYLKSILTGAWQNVCYKPQSDDPHYDWWRTYF